MQGDITVRSQVDEGSIFHFEISLVEGVMQPAGPPAEPRLVTGLQPGQPAPRVLIADDRRENRELLTQMLGQTGFETRAVDDGAQAIREFLAWQPHLILLDMRIAGHGRTRGHPPDSRARRWRRG